MKFWVKLSRIIFKIAVSPWLKKIRSKSIEAVLKKSIPILEPEMLDEMRAFVQSQQTSLGGFADRGGKCDLYYSLFGYYLADALIIPEVTPLLRQYIKKVISETTLSGVNLYCGAILYVKLHGFDSYTERLKRQIVSVLEASDLQQPEYANFLGIMALYYLEDFLNIKRIIHPYKSHTFQDDLPCPVLAATIVLLEIAGKTKPESQKKLFSFYRAKGGFASFKYAPSEDLLSTGVALYALSFMNADTRMIKPECMSFIDGLYHNGGFMSMPADNDIDVEYAFYGLLALGSLQEY
jgi:hypothetical protein